MPLSTRASTERRYAIVDPYLRFWLRFVEPGLGEIERGMGATLAPRIAADFATFRGHAIEPLVREALSRLSLADDRTFEGARAVGGFWTRDNAIKIDLVGADRPEPPANTIAFIGTIKWRETGRVVGSDVAALTRASAAVAGVDASTRLVAVSRTGFDRRIAAPVRKVDPDEILAAFPAD